MFGDSKYTGLYSPCKTHFEELSTILWGVFVGRVNSYEELMQGLLAALDLLDTEGAQQLDTFEAYLELHKEQRQQQDSPSDLRAKLFAMLTFLMCEYAVGCESFYFRWASLLHTYNVHMYGEPDSDTRAPPPLLRKVFFDFSEP